MRTSREDDRAGPQDPATPLEAQTHDLGGDERSDTARLEATVRAMHRLHELHATLAAETDLETGLAAIVSAAAEFCETDRGCVQLVSADGERLELFVQRGFAPDSAFVDHLRRDGPNAACDASRASRGRVLIEDVATAPALHGTKDRRVALAEGVRATQSTPMIDRQGDLVGVLGVQFREPHRSSDDMLEVVDLLASTAADFVTRNRVEAALSQATEESARRREEEFRIALKAGRFGAWSFDLATNELMSSDECRTDYGRSAEDSFSYDDLLAAIHPEDRRRMRDAVERSIATGEDYDIDYRIVTPAGETRWVQVRGQASYDAAGAPVRMSGVSIDITKRRQAEAELRETLERLHLATDHAEIGFWDVDPVNDRLIWPARTKAMFGISADVPVTMRDFYEGLHPDDQTATSEAYAAAADPVRRALYDVEYRTIGKEDGVVRWVAAKGRGVFDEAGRCLRVAGTAIDVTAKKAVEARLRELNETLEAQVAARTIELRRFRDIVEATTSPICAFDRDYRLIAFNKAHNDEFRRVNGFDTKLGDVFPDLFIPEQRRVMRELMGRALSGESFTVEAEFGRPEFGQPAWEITYTPLRDERGAVIGAFHLATDLSERMRAAADLAATQEALRQSQKMEAMGQLTGGVAHDFNNLLTPIIGSLDMLMRKGIGSERERRLIDGALQSAERAKTLVQRLLAFARRQPLQPVAVDIGRLVGGMVGLIESTLGPAIDIRVDVAPDLPAASADPNQLEMALLNLAVNARDAMPGGGELTIAATSGLAREAQPSGVTPGRYVRLSVSDTGAGMDEATLARAVEPFFSTKGVGKGTGLGLSMVHGLAAQLRGGLTIDSAPGRGTTIELWLPVSAAGVGDAEATPPVPPACPGRGTVLLVDDEELVRMSTADMLTDLGFAVVEAPSAEEALRLLAGGAAPDLLVTDHLMPGMTGAELARAAMRVKPRLPVLIVSGYAEADGIAPDLPRLTKPFRNAELAASVAALVPAADG